MQRVQHFHHAPVCHLGGARSLREIVGGLEASEGKLKHLGVDRALDAFDAGLG